MKVKGGHRPFVSPGAGKARTEDKKSKKSKKKDKAGKARKKDKARAPDLDHKASLEKRLDTPRKTRTGAESSAQADFAPSAGGVGGAGGGLLRFTLEVDGRDNVSGPVAALMAEYGVSERMGRPRERILAQAGELLGKLAEAHTPEEVASALEDGMTRFSLFKLEGALKLYRREYGEPVEALYDTVKSLEDKAGEVARFKDRLASAEELGLDPAACEVLSHTLEQARTALRKEVADNGWSSDEGLRPAVQNLLDTLGGLDWESGKKDRKTVLKEFKRRAEKATQEFDVNELQGESGLHELRRQLRWVLLYANALDGLIELDDSKNPVKAFVPLLDSDIGSTKYGSLPDSSREKDTAKVSKSVFFALNEFVVDIGDIKDQRERVEDFAHALVEAGKMPNLESAMAHAETLVLGGPEGAEKIEHEVQRLLGELAEHDPVQAFVDEL